MPKDHPYVGSLREEFFREQASGKRQYTILLDGTNEVGFSSGQNRKIFLETLNHYLTHAHNVRFILTGRSDIYELNSKHIQRIYARGLDDLAIEEMLLSAVDHGKLPLQEYQRILSGRHDFFSNEYRLWQCLQVPFFLMMYCVMEQSEFVSRQGEILGIFSTTRERLWIIPRLMGISRKDGNGTEGKSIGKHINCGWICPSV